MSVPVLFYGLAVVSFILFLWSGAASSVARDDNEPDAMKFLLALSLVCLIATPVLVAVGAGV
ncbi:hypothetical protein SEA_REDWATTLEHOG_65 [Gordonia phage RedWattleHog]|uniref:Uncharacterized protein n=1 Tax=Gordonia phage Stormageddon TaxID=2656541 RepID=A0A649VSE4_9CAUD|nr:hypothetical protein KHQ86_gp062 [Gordonia phage Stormageddon]QGJ94925.1 hypothetical protein SEA_STORMAGEDDON_62 [Gordonia phage Stormageddon]QLF83569.1 hypothetical protein SEA_REDWATTLEHOG_65 [Gordonia phage RedWattleHog]